LTAAGSQTPNNKKRKSAHQAGISYAQGMEAEWLRLQAQFTTARPERERQTFRMNVCFAHRSLAHHPQQLPSKKEKHLQENVVEWQPAHTTKENSGTSGK